MLQNVPTEGLHDIPTEGAKYKIILFNLHCLSALNEVCDKCNKYWPNEAAIKGHKKAHKKQKIKIEMESDVSESEDVSEEITNDRLESEFMPVFQNIFNLFKSPFVKI